MSRRRPRAEDKQPPVEYRDPEGNVLALRGSMTPGTRRLIMDLAPRGAQTLDDAWQRRGELLFERLAVSWAIAGLEPITGQRPLLDRYRIASGPEREWVDRTVREHVHEHFPELGDG